MRLVISLLSDSLLHLPSHPTDEVRLPFLLALSWPPKPIELTHHFAGLTAPARMDWDGPLTRPSFWTPSIPPLERHLPLSGPSITLYRALRIAWVLSLLPLHLFLVLLSLLPLFYRALPPYLVPGKRQRWNPQQRLIYPLLRRVIWSVCDVGQPGSLTPSGPRTVPFWAWALEEFTVRIGGGARVELDVRDVEMPRRAREEGWVKGEVVDPRGRVEFGTVPCFWFERSGEGEGAGKGRGRCKARSEKERVILYFVGGGYA